MYSESKIITEKEQNSSYNGYMAMENLMEKLKILKFHSEFTSALKMKPIHRYIIIQYYQRMFILFGFPIRYYFIVPKNPGEQFFLFTCLCAWLIRKCGDSFETPQESDDPNTTISTILDVVREKVT